MSEVFAEAQRELASLLERHAARPREALVQLLLMALEREELVSVGYRESLMVPRLRAMPIDDEVREIIRHALVWTWKDEEMHSLYIRGTLLRLGSLPLRLKCMATQAAGAVAGWASSAVQHTRWRQAPLSRLLAGLITTAGSVLGKLPKAVREQLQFGPFRLFCLFNIELEQASELSWVHIVRLAEQEPDFTPATLDDFRRVIDDEARHGQVFAILAEALDSDDRLVPGETPASLAAKLRGVGEHYLSRAHRGTRAVENPLGSGGRVWCRRGETAEEKVALFRRLLDESGLRERLAERARFLGRPLPEMRVAIKPTFMLGYHRKDRSPITDPALIAELAAWLREQGCTEVSVVEGRNIYGQFYRHRSVGEVARYFGIESPHFRVVDLAEEQVPHRYSRGMAQATIGRSWKEADFRITFGKLRSHPVDVALLSVANLESVGARSDEFLFVERQADRATALMMLLDDFPPHFALLEGYDLAPDGLVGMMGSPRPRTPRRLYAGADALAVDMVAARHLGVRDPGESSLLTAANHWFGGWSARVEVVGCDEPLRDWRGPYSNELWAMMSFCALAMYVFGSGRGVRFVPEMDEEAFPPIAPESWFLRFRRRNIRALVGLRHPRRASEDQAAAAGSQ
ncbi:MAG TPA: DUF362 domain-containing protein [Chthoniobacteraceae bacterium]|nr:DUF362 domain-containing protein [Chthoniobacteraceae bacterium]